MRGLADRVRPPRLEEDRRSLGSQTENHSCPFQCRLRQSLMDRPFLSLAVFAGLSAGLTARPYDAATATGESLVGTLAGGDTYAATVGPRQGGGASAVRHSTICRASCSGEFSTTITP
jgi:hypothetical protein